MTEHRPSSQSLSDPLDPARATALAATLGRDGAFAMGDPLPPFFHQVYFWEPQPPANLGRDGHPKTGGFLPDLGLPRRMWAAGRVQWHRPLLAGIKAEKESHIEAITRKEGRAGPLAFVRVRHDIRQRSALALTEWQELVYLTDGAVRPAPPVARTDEDIAASVDFDSTTLFRYSALTFNGHRIHYDEDYARSVEGYGGLVVHGPLLAQHLMLLADAQIGPLKSVSYRATAPLMHYEQATLCWKAPGSLWVRGPDGRQCMEAQAE